MRRKARFVIIVTTLILLAALVLVGQRLLSGPRVREPFTLTGAFDEAAQASYLSSDTYRMLTSASPFYAGTRPAFGQRLDEFETVRAAKVTQIRDAAARVAVLALALRPQCERLRQAYITAASAIEARDPRLKKLCQVSSRELVAACLRREVALACYQSLEIPTENRFAEASQQYRQTLLAMTLSLATLRDTELLLSAALNLNAACRDAKDAGVKEALDTLDREMRSYTDVARDANTLWQTTHQVHAGLRQLATGDYYLARSALAFMTATLPEVTARAEKMMPSESLSKADIALVRQYVTLFAETTDSLELLLDAVPADALAAVPTTPEYIGAAWAFKDGGNYEKGYKTLAQGLRKEKMTEFLPISWKVAKELPGLTTGTANVLTYTGIRILTGLTNGNSYKDITTDIMRESKRLNDDIANGIAGASTLKTAKAYMQGLETRAQKAVADYLHTRLAGEAKSPQGWAPWLAGNAAKATVSLFTGFAKGIYAVTDPSATRGELAEGALEIGFTFLGGSKVLLSPALTTSGAKGVAQASVLSAQRLLNSLKASNLAKGSAAEVAASKALFTAIAQSNAAIDTRLVILAKDGTLTWAGKASAMARDSLREMLATSFPRTLKGLADALATAVGKSPRAFAENWLGQNVDDVIKDFTRTLLDAPAVSLAGKWSGTTTISKATISNLPGHPSAADLQRVHAALAALSGKVTPIVINLKTANAGTLSGGGTSMPVTVKVNGDAVVMTTRQGAAATSYTGTLTTSASSHIISGAFSAKSTEVGIMTITGTFKVSRAL